MSIIKSKDAIEVSVASVKSLGNKFIKQFKVRHLIFLIIITYMVISMKTITYIRGNDRMFCNQVRTQSRYKFFKNQVQPFRDITIKYASYFKATDEKAFQASSDPALWLILFNMANGKIKLDEMPNHMSRRSFNYSAICDANGQPKVRENRHFRTYDDDKKQLQSRKNSELWQLLLEQKDLNLANLRNNLELEKEIREYQRIPSEPERIGIDEKFILYDGVVFGEKFRTLSEASQITLATDTSMYQLNIFLITSAKWNGPISLAVFLSGKLEYFLFRGYLSYLKRCHREVYERTIFSLATPIESPIFRYSTIQTKDFDHINCTTATDEVTLTITYNLKESKQWLKKNNYSSTIMRNLSISNIRTPYHLALNIDTIPCPNMSENLNTFLTNNVLLKDGFIIPTYELTKAAHIPGNKAELVTLSRQGLALPTFSFNNKLRKFARWEELNDSFEKVKIIDKVDVQSFNEAFSIVSNHNENFVDDRSTEWLNVRTTKSPLKNGDFALLSPVFAIQLAPQENQTPSILDRTFA